MQKRQKEKKAMMNAVKKYQKGDYFKERILCVDVINMWYCFHEYVIYDSWCLHI